MHYLINSLLLLGSVAGLLASYLGVRPLWYYWALAAAAWCAGVLALRVKRATPSTGARWAALTVPILLTGLTVVRLLAGPSPMV